MPASLRGSSLAAVILLAALWLAPVLLLPRVAARLLEAAGTGVELEFVGVRPALPWGVTVQRLVVSRAGGKVEVAELSARLVRWGVRVEGSFGAGTLLFRTRGLTLRGGLRAQSLPLASLDGIVPGAASLRGTADGVYRFGEHDALELTVSRGSLALRGPLAVELPFAQLVLAAGREDDGAWRVDFADVRGPPLSASAHGRVHADGQLALRVEISQLEEPALSAFRLAALPTGPLPFTAELGGTLDQPTLTAVGAHAR